jgi:hypothetical protein
MLQFGLCAVVCPGHLGGSCGQVGGKSPTLRRVEDVIGGSKNGTAPTTLAKASADAAVPSRN